MEAFEARVAALWLPQRPRERLEAASSATPSSRLAFSDLILVGGIVLGEVAWLSAIAYAIRGLLA